MEFKYYIARRHMNGERLLMPCHLLPREDNARITYAAHASAAYGDGQGAISPDITVIKTAIYAIFSCSQNALRAERIQSSRGLAATIYDSGRRGNNILHEVIGDISIHHRFARQAALGCRQAD